MKSIFDKYNDVELQQLLNESDSMRSVLVKVGLSSNGGNSYDSLRKRLKKSNLNIDHFNSTKNLLNIHNSLPNELVFCENSNLARGKIKKRIIDNNLIDYVCSECGISSIWNKKPIVLQLDHINGINNDNRLNNLRFLCPNCHSQTATYTSKKLKENVNYICNMCGKDRKMRTSNICQQCSQVNQSTKFNVDKNELKKLIESKISFRQIGKMFNVSDNAIRKRAKKYSLI